MVAVQCRLVVYSRFYSINTTRNDTQKYVFYSPSVKNRKCCHKDTVTLCHSLLRCSIYNSVFKITQQNSKTSHST